MTLMRPPMIKNEITDYTKLGDKLTVDHAMTLDFVEGLQSRIAVLEKERERFVEYKLVALADEMDRANAKFPGNRLLASALAEEVGEMADAWLNQNSAHARQEALQVACVAMRIVVQGPNDVDQSRAVLGMMADLEAPARRNLESPEEKKVVLDLQKAIEDCRDMLNNGKLTIFQGRRQ